MEENNTINQSPLSNQPLGQMPIPNSTAVLVLGILSIVFCFCYGIIGLIMGIIALVLSNKAMALYNDNSANYTLASLNNLKAGKICAIIGVILSALMMVYAIVILAIIGGAISVMPWDQLMNH